MTGWQNIHSAFLIWRDLMTDNFDNYALLKSVDDPFEECYSWFWGTLGEDDVYPKEFLEHLLQMVDDIETGKEKLIPMGEDFMKELQELVKDVELDDD
jgi:hypothetical protein